MGNPAVWIIEESRRKLPAVFTTLNCLTINPNLGCEAVGEHTQNLKLPDFDAKGCIHTFIHLFEMTTIGFSNVERATAVITCLDLALQNLVMPSLPLGIWSFAEAKTAMIQEFGSEDKLTNQQQSSCPSSSKTMRQ